MCCRGFPVPNHPDDSGRSNVVGLCHCASCAVEKVLPMTFDNSLPCHGIVVRTDMVGSSSDFLFFGGEMGNKGCDEFIYPAHNG